MIIATYDYDDPGLRGLIAPAHDAEALAEVLRDPLIGGFEVTALINEPHHKVGEAVGDFYTHVRRDDLTLLYFSGHGLKDEGGKLYLATTNTRPLSPLFTSLPADQLDYAMTNSPSRRQVLILDCCYSGAFPSGAIAKSGDAVHAVERLGGRGRTVLTASDATQYAFEGGVIRGTAQQSVFTRHLVAGLRDGSADLDHDGDITIDELYSYVHDKVVEERPQQRPKKQDNVEGRTVLAANVNWTIPGYVRNALNSPLSRERLTALEHFDHLHQIGNPAVRARLRDEARFLLDDDSRSVSAAAHNWLESHAATPSVAEGPESAESVSAQRDLRGAVEGEPTSVAAVAEPDLTDSVSALGAASGSRGARPVSIVVEPVPAGSSDQGAVSAEGSNSAASGRTAETMVVADPDSPSPLGPGAQPADTASDARSEIPSNDQQSLGAALGSRPVVKTSMAGASFAMIRRRLSPHRHLVVAVAAVMLLVVAISTFVLARSGKLPWLYDVGESSAVGGSMASASAAIATLPFPSLVSPNAVAVDDAGTVYVADNSVLKLPGGSATAVELPFPPFDGGDRPRVLALDSTGAVYVADSSRVFMLGSGAATAETLPFTGFSDIKGLAVDSRRTVYILARNSANGDNIQQVWMWERGGAGVVQARGIPGPLDYVGLAIDSKGRLYTGAAAQVNGPAARLLAYSVSGARQDFAGLRSPRAVAVDQSGALYFGGDDIVYKLPPWFEGGVATRLSLSGLVDVKGLAATTYGGVYIADNGGPDNTGRVVHYIG
ncbi:caspase family protein [Nocardia sp. NPDC057440]|uniref:caspase, EACC1-associated type n=1 Tax=Nocardia sp. NPDC057440 TaxID=3346134 RepID=UPI00366C075A